MKTPRQIVFDNLDNALANGDFEWNGDLVDRTPIHIATDLVDCASDCECFEPESLVDYVRAFRVDRGV